MEAMEETENEGKEPAENGSAGRYGMAGREQPERSIGFTTYTVAVNLAMTKEF